MPDPEQYDAVVIGSGEGGKYLAWHLARAGHRTAVVERRWIGGSCPNINCLPSKNEIWSAGIAHTVSRAAAFGVTTGPIAVAMATVVKRKREMVADLIAVHLEQYRASGAELIMGTARVVAPKTVEIALNDGGTRRLVANRLFLNLGTHASIPAIPGLAGVQPLTNIEALELERLPEHLIVLGGGYVGLEFAQAYRRFGSRVTIVEHGDRLLSREDPDVSTEVLRILRAEGIEVLSSADLEHIEGRSGDRLHARLRTPENTLVLEGTDILVAAGRTPNTGGIGLVEHGIELTERGYIRVNERLETTAGDVWAIGECAGSPQFTHISLDDFRIIRDNMAADAGRRPTGSCRIACSSIRHSPGSDSASARPGSAGSPCASRGYL